MGWHKLPPLSLGRHNGQLSTNEGTLNGAKTLESWKMLTQSRRNSFAFDISCCYPRVEPADPQSRARCIHRVLTSGINSKEPGAGIGKPVGILIDR